VRWIRFQILLTILQLDDNNEVVDVGIRYNEGKSFLQWLMHNLISSHVKISYSINVSIARKEKVEVRDNLTDGKFLDWKWVFHIVRIV
jgi:hypothetical protein